jgi:hypothetical protein
MKPSQLLEELTDTAQRLGFTIRRDSGSFKSGWCVVNDRRMIILNKTGTKESSIRILSVSVSQFMDELYIKPALREHIENELAALGDKIKEFELEVRMERVEQL